MRKKYKIWLIVIGVLLAMAIGLGVLKWFMPKEDNKKEENVTNVISNIKEFGYSLDDRDTDYMKEIFKDLEETLKTSNINYEEYAKNLAKLFIIDFYTLDNKINKYDVGSLEYIYSKSLNDFKNKAMATIYSDVMDNTYKDRIQDLPEISNVEVVDITKEEVTIKEQKEEAFKVRLKFTYKKDLGYDKEGTVYLVKNLNKLEVVLYKPSLNDDNKVE